MLVEVGPGGSLTGSALRMPGWSDTHRAVRLMRHPVQTRDDRDAFLLALGQLWSAGVDVDWARLYGEHPRRVTLPGYSFARQRHWIEPDTTAVSRTGGGTQVAVTTPAGADTGAPVDARAQMQATLQRIWSQCLGVEAVAPGRAGRGAGQITTSIRPMLASRPPDSRLLPSMALLCGAVVWGLIWYPYRVIEAATGHEGLQVLESHRPDLVLCDVMMPDVSGMDVYAHINSARPDYGKRFVFMTGGAFTPKAREFLESVANEHIEKPFSIRELRNLVSKRAVGT